MNDARMRLLAVVQRKLDIELECARSVLARLREDGRTQEDGLQHLQASCRDHERQAGLRVGATVDAAVRAQALRHLVHLQVQLACGERRAQDLRDRIDEAVARCVARESRCASTRELREAAEHQRSVGVGRRAAAEADRAWLARCARIHAAGAAE